MLDKRLKKRVIREGLKPFLERNIDAWEMSADGRYKHRKGGRARNAHPQNFLLDLADAGGTRQRHV